MHRYLAAKTHEIVNRCLMTCRAEEAGAASLEPHSDFHAEFTLADSSPAPKPDKLEMNGKALCKFFRLTRVTSPPTRALVKDGMRSARDLSTLNFVRRCSKMRLGQQALKVRLLGVFGRPSALLERMALHEPGRICRQ